MSVRQVFRDAMAVVDWRIESGWRGMRQRALTVYRPDDSETTE